MNIRRIVIAFGALIATLAVMISSFCLVAAPASADGRFHGCAARKPLLRGGNGHAVRAPRPRDTGAVGHRGSVGLMRSGAYADPNTLRSATRLFRKCGDVVELDLQLSRDRVFVVRHGDFLWRSTNCPLSVAQTYWSRIANCRTAHGSRVNSFRRFMAAQARHGCSGIGIQPEVKNVHPTRDNIRKALGRIRSARMSACALVPSAQFTTLRYVKSVNPHIQTGLIRRDHGRPSVKKLRSKAWKQTVNYLMLDKQAVTPRYVRTAHRLGYRVSARSVGTVRALRRLTLGCHVDQFVTGKIVAMLRARRNL
jgi:glycerophosphoryl diester phosphodiesterase